jgi:hypothetical protein
MTRIWQLSVLASHLGPEVYMRPCHTSPMHAGQSSSMCTSPSSSMIAVSGGRPMKQRRHLMSLALVVPSHTMCSTIMRPCGCRSDRSALSLGVVSTSSEPRRTSAGHLVVVVVNKQQSRCEKEQAIVASNTAPSTQG